MSPHTEPNLLQRFGRLKTLTTGWYLAVSGIARLPISMTNLGILTLVSSVTGSYTSAGMAVAATGLANAVGGPIIGAIADRQGQRRVMNVAIVINLLSLGFLLWTSFNYPDLSVGWMIAAAALAGLSTPQVAPLARARWMAITTMANPNNPVAQRRELDTALSFESTADELGFAIGPAIVGLIAGVFNPALAIIFAALIIILFTSSFANHPWAAKVHAYQQDAHAEQLRTKVEGGPAPSRWWTQIIYPVAGMVGQGTFFGATGVAVLSYASNQGLGDSGGLLYGAMGLMSGFTALSVASWPANFTNRARWLTSAIVLFTLVWWLYLESNSPLWLVLIILLLLGIPVGPTMVTAFSTVSEYTPATRLATAMTVTQAGIVLGISLGNAAGGVLVEEQGPAGGFLLAAAAGSLILLSSVANYVQKRIYHRGGFTA